MAHQVVSAYATLRVPNDFGQEVILGFYKDAILPADVNRDDLERHIRKGMVVKVAGPAAEPAAEADSAEPAKKPAAAKKS